MQIVRLTDSLDPRIEGVCDTMLGWWGVREGFSREKMRTYLGHLVNAGQTLPQFFILTQGSAVIGSFQLSMQDIDVRPDLYPWLINVFIRPESRGNGYLARIMDTVRNEMDALGLHKIYLYTRHEGLYERYGFVHLDTFKTYITPDDIQRLYVLHRHADPKERP